MVVRVDDIGRQPHSALLYARFFFGLFLLFRQYLLHYLLITLQFNRLLQKYVLPIDSILYSVAEG